MKQRHCSHRVASARWLYRLTLAGLLLFLPIHLAAGEKDSKAQTAVASPQDGAGGQAGASATDVEGDEAPTLLSLSADHSHVRVTDARLRHVLEQAAQASPTLQRLVSRLQASDVVAYVEYDLRQRSRLAGHLTFVSAAGGLRYVLIRVAYLGVAPLQAAVVGHELRHAVEVADLHDIVDVSSLEHEFSRIGFESRAGSTLGSKSYETRQAQDAGDQILRELTEARTDRGRLISDL